MTQITVLSDLNKVSISEWDGESLFFSCLCLGKLPKNYDPTANPDPERWLPMRERTYYRGRKKGKKKEQVGKGTQGATSGAASDL